VGGRVEAGGLLENDRLVLCGRRGEANSNAVLRERDADTTP
jgi:hypothetical protein